MYYVCSAMSPADPATTSTALPLNTKQSSMLQIIADTQFMVAVVSDDMCGDAAIHSSAVLAPD
jgi:hypothetical protein